MCIMRDIQIEQPSFRILCGTQNICKLLNNFQGQTSYELKINEHHFPTPFLFLTSESIELQKYCHVNGILNIFQFTHNTQLETYHFNQTRAYKDVFIQDIFFEGSSIFRIFFEMLCHKHNVDYRLSNKTTNRNELSCVNFFSLILK